MLIVGVLSEWAWSRARTPLSSGDEGRLEALLEATDLGVSNWSWDEGKLARLSSLLWNLEVVVPTWLRERGERIRRDWGVEVPFVFFDFSCAGPGSPGCDAQEAQVVVPSVRERVAGGGHVAHAERDGHVPREEP